MPMNLFNFFRRLLTDSHVYFACKVLIAISGIVAFSVTTGDLKIAVLLSLGVVAGAIAETDDHFLGRIKNLAMTLACFLFASFSVQYLFPWPWLFAIGLACSSFLFVMVGALGQRYATISFGSLLIAVYTMLGAATAPNLYHQPLLLSAGALWYGVISLIWLLVLPHKTLHEQLAQGFYALGRYLCEKSKLFPADEPGTQALRHRLAQLNIDVVQAMTLAKSSLNSRLGYSNDPELGRLLQLYLLGQEIHERATSSHYPYSQLEQDLKQEMVLAGFQEVLLQLGEACQQLGHSIMLHTPYQHSRRTHWALQALDDQLEFTHLKQHYPSSLLTPMKFLRKNLANINTLLASAANLQASHSAQVAELAKPQRIGWQQLKRHASLDSLLLRHALRMSLGLVLGYGLLQVLSLERGYWILLTLLFVCQPSYSATRRRLMQRMLGTFIGILLGVPVLLLLPNPDAQLMVMGLAAFLFFTQVRLNYSAAVCFITLYVLMAFNLLDNQGLAIVAPRLFDTTVGCLLSYVLVAWLWPDWQYKRLPALIATSLCANATYLDHVLALLHQGRSESLDYRVARKQAHLADSELALAWQSMLVEPQSRRRFLDLCFSLTWHNHALLSYISALGAHRDQLEGIEQLPPVRQYLLDTLQQAARQISAEQPLGDAPAVQPELLDEVGASDSDEQRMLTQLLVLIRGQAEELLALAYDTRLLTTE